MTIPSGDREQRVSPPSTETEWSGLPGVPDTGQDPLGKTGTVIGGKFRILGHVKGGGFAEVYQGFNVNLKDQRVIIKFLRDQTLADRFAKEAQLLCRLDHPNICRVIDYLPDEHAIIVPFIDGKDCERIIRSSGPLAPDVFIKVALTITDALAYAHARKIAHRDLKPGNIIIDRHGMPYLIDFGIAKEIDADSTSTRTGYVALTPQFAAPERQSGEIGYNPFLSDIYEMGVTLCVLATGELPYRNAAYPSLRDWDRSFQRPLSQSLRIVLQHAAHPTPAERVQTAAELARLLRQVGIAEVPAKGAKAVRILSLAFGLTVLGLLAWKFGPWSDRSTSQPQSTLGAPGSSDNLTPPTSGSDIPDGETAVPAKVETPADVIIPPDTPTPIPSLAPVQPHVRVDVSPREGSICFIDGLRQSLDRERAMSEGVHRLRIVNPRFPILERSFRVAARDTALVYDLAQEFSGREIVDLRIALNPPSSEYDLEVVVNGSPRTFSSFPVRDIKCHAGRWEIEMRLAARGQSQPAQARVDSTVTFPYGGGPHISIRGGRGELDFSGEAWTGKRVVPLLVNWSVVQKQ